MRFPLASLLLICGSFIFFVLWAVGSRLLTIIGDQLMDVSSIPQLDALIELLQYAFGVIAVLFFIAALLIPFFLDATADEQELYWR